MGGSLEEYTKKLDRVFPPVGSFLWAYLTPTPRPPPPMSIPGDRIWPLLWAVTQLTMALSRVG